MLQHRLVVAPRSGTGRAPNKRHRIYGREYLGQSRMVLLMFAALLSLLSAQAQSKREEKPPATPWFQKTRFLGDLPELGRLEQLGLRFSLFLNHFVGLDADRIRQSGSVDLFITADFEKMGGFSGGEALMQLKSNRGVNVNPFVGAISDPIDDADFNVWIYIDQLYYQHTWAKGLLQLRLGYLDQQTILDRNRYANSEDTQFMTTLLDNHNVILPLKIGIGATLFIRPSKSWSLTLGTADADNRILLAGLETAFDSLDTLMFYTQLDFHSRLQLASGPLPGNYRFGLFYDPREKTVFGRTDAVAGEPLVKRGDVGFYLSFDQAFWRAESRTQELGVFFRYGHLRADRNRITDSWSTGLQVQGAFPRRSRDLLGFGFYSVHSSEQFRRHVDPRLAGEKGLELFYQFQLSPWLAVTPGFQLIDDPGGQNSAQDARLFVVRTRLSF